ncbi:MAG TPA: hypothetical protein VKH20_01200 [Solirubrobacterales bacterium]|nr:hypothetical protein [Solirubrobacterales bacterium]
MVALPMLASLSDKVVEPLVNVATEFIGSAGVVAVFLLMILERQLGKLAPQARLSRLPGAGRDRGWGDLPGGEAAAGATSRMKPERCWRP